MAQSRVVFHVMHARGQRPWRLKKSGVTVRTYRIKVLAIEDGRILCRTLWNKGRPAQLVVHGRQGKIQFESTYGKDPKRYRS
jgi:hypothetical protein